MKTIRNLHRVVSLALILMLVIALFAGCGGAAPQAPAAESQSTVEAPPESAPEASAQEPETPEPETQEPEQAEAEESEPAPEEMPEEPEPEAPAPWEPVETVFPISENPVTFSVFMNSPENINQGVVEDLNDVTVLQEVCNKANVFLTFEYASFISASERYNLIIASRDLPDLMSCNVTYNGGNVKAVEDDIYIALNELIPDCMPNYGHYLGEDDIYSYVVENDGSIVSIYRLYNKNKDASFGHVVRQDWLDALGLDIPVTYDDYTEVMRAFHNAYGCSDPYLLSGSAMSCGGPNLVSGYGNIGFKVNGTPGSHFYREGDEVHSALLEEGYHDYVTMLHNWYEEGLIGRDFLNNGDFFLDGTNLGKISSDQTGIFYAGQDFLDTYGTMSQNPDFALTGIAPPVSEGVSVNHFNDNIQRCVSSTYANVTTACQDPETLCRFIDYWYSGQGMIDYSYGVEGVSYERAPDGSVNFTDAVWNDPDFSPNTALYKYCFYMALFGLQDSDQQQLFYSDLTAQAVGVWSSNTDDAGLLPPISINDPEYTSTLNDIDTYASENVLAFITGTRSLDEWDSFVDQLKSMGLEDCLSMVQKEYSLRADAAASNPFKQG